MTESRLPAGFRKTALKLTVAALVLFAVPFPFYAWSRATGALPSESEWWARGVNHGPWRWELPMALVIIPMYLLPAAAIVAVGLGVIWSSKQRRGAPIGLALVQAAVFVGLFYAQASLLYWTID
jgi:hypothetical protein